MSGYLKGREADMKSLNHTRPGGSMIATAEDVGIFLRALIDGALFNEKEQSIYSSLYEYEHTGWLHGYTSIARFHSDIDAVVVQFVNTSGKEIFWLKFTFRINPFFQLCSINGLYRKIRVCFKFQLQRRTLPCSHCAKCDLYQREKSV